MAKEIKKMPMKDTKKDSKKRGVKKKRQQEKRGEENFTMNLIIEYLPKEEERARRLQRELIKAGFKKPVMHEAIP